MDRQQLEELFERELMPDSSPATVPEPGTPVQVIEQMGEDDDKIVMDDSEITDILSRHIKSSSTWMGSTIALDQAKAMKYYLGLAEDDLAPPPIAGRSTIVDTTVSDQIEWMIPALMEIFFASGDVVKYGPRKRTDADAARQMTALMNYVVVEDNPGFELFMEWFKNSLLNKIGVAKVYWKEESYVKREYYDNQTDAQLGMLAQDASIEIIKITSYVDPNAEIAAMNAFKQQQQAVEQWAQAQQQAAASGMPFPPPSAPAQPGMPPPPPMQAPQPPQPIDLSKLPQLHNVVAKIVKKEGKATYAALNPEDILIEERSRRIEDGFSAHRMLKTVSELEAEGYENLDNLDLDAQDITSNPDAESLELSAVPLARQSLQDTFIRGAAEDYGDESMRRVWLYECYLPMDCDKDGIAEWRKIVIAGNAVLSNEICDGCPFAVLCPVPIPGLLIGRSIADLGMPIALAKTGILRALVDNMNVQVNGRTWAIENQVNIADLLTNRPGGVVRVKSANAVGSLNQGMADSQGAYQLLEFLDTASQERTGATKYSQGQDSDALNKTATGYKGITQRADLRTKLVARCFAESGVKRLFQLMQKLLCEHQDQAMVFELNGEWFDIDPRVWNNQYTMKTTVGLGTGDQTTDIQSAMALLQVQQTAAQGGYVTPQNLMNSFSDLIYAMKKGKPADYFTLPSAPPPPPPDPNMALVQGQLQIKAAEAQANSALENAKFQHTQQIDAQEFEQKKQTMLLREQLLDARERDQFQQQNQWDREKFYAQLAATRVGNAEKAGVDAMTEVQMNNLILKDAEGNSFSIPHGMLANFRQQNIDSAHKTLDRQHDAEQQDLDRQQAAEQAQAQLDARQAGQVQSAS